MTLRTALPLFFAACVAGCSSAPTPLPTASTPTLPGQWILQQSGSPADGTIRLALHQTPPREGTAVLDVSGFSGVNHYTGVASFNADQHMLIMGDLATTREIGPAPKMQAEGAYLQKLGQVTGYQWKDNSLLVLKTLAGDSLTFTKATDSGQ